METRDIKKVIFAHPGGLGTSIIIPQLKENYNGCEIIAVSADVEQRAELDGLKGKAIKTSASKLYILNLKDEFVEGYIYPCLKTNAIYEDIYLLDTAFARPLTGQRLVEIVKQEGTGTICHGCTGKGNDQVRFELAVKVFALDIPIIAPWRTWELKSRDDEIDYAEAHNIPLKISRETSYSKDKSLQHLSHEGLDLEDPMNELQYGNILEMGVALEQAPDTPTYVTLTFEKGIPTTLNGEKLGGQAIVTKLNEIGGTNGIDIIDVVKNRLVGMESRSIYETLGGIILYKAYQWLESVYLDKETMHYKQRVGIKFGGILYSGQWFTPLHETLNALVGKTSKTVSGKTKVKLCKGNLIPASTSSPYTLCSEQIASFGGGDSYSQSDSADFINLYGLPVKVKTIMDEKRKKQIQIRREVR